MATKKKKATKPKEKNKRAVVYDKKVAIKGTLDEVLKVSSQPKKKG